MTTRAAPPRPPEAHRECPVCGEMWLGGPVCPRTNRHGQAASGPVQTSATERPTARTRATRRATEIVRDGGQLTEAPIPAVPILDPEPVKAQLRPFQRSSRWGRLAPDGEVGW